MSHQDMIYMDRKPRDSWFARMRFWPRAVADVGGGGGATSLDFSDPDNSQYLGMISIGGL